METAFIVSATRTAVGKSSKGGLKNVRPDDLAATVIAEVVNRAKVVDKNEIDDVIFGCALPEGEQGLNFSRLASLRAGLPHTVPAFTINRFCSSGLQTISLASERITCGNADIIIAGGAESMSMIPMSGRKFSANPVLVDEIPNAYLSMGLTAENVAKQFGITRQMQDEFAFKSHANAIAAIKSGKFKDEIVPLKFITTSLDKNEKKINKENIFEVDEGPREDTTIEKLSALKPVFALGGTVTAGNSSQTSDGAAAVMVMSENKMKQLNLQPLARLISFAVGGVPPEIMGIGPIVAIPKALKRAGLKLSDIDLIELNEAFASQSYYIIKNLEMDESKVNVNGGAIALGHPLGCSGAKLTVSIINEAKRRKAKYGLVTMCIGGGMGAAGVFEFYN